MNILDKILIKLNIEYHFLLEQKWGTKKPDNPFSISKSILKKYLTSNPVMIDCGAHIGADSIELARIFPKGKVHSFEPVPFIYKQLQKNSKKFPNINCYPIALSNEDGYAQIQISEGGSDASSSLLIPKEHLIDHKEVLFKESLKVKTETLDTWAEKNNILRIDFLWLDMQGFEMQMLKASTKVLPTVKVIFTEVSIKETYEGVILYNEYRSWLESIGFTMEIEMIPKASDQGNVLFVRK